MQNESRAPDIGLMGALSIGVGGIVGGGFFATFGITVAGAQGATPLAFLLAGAIALMTAYSYIGLALHFPGPGGTVSYISRAFGSGMIAASVNVLLVLSYIAIMSVYASALASYALPYVPEEMRPVARHVIASVSILAMGAINFAGAGVMERLEGIFNVGKLTVLGVFIVAGFAVGSIDWGRMEPAGWPAVSTIVASGMLGFLAYEGFELIANASDRIRNPSRTLPIAFLGSVLIAMVIYALAFVVGIGHLDFAAIHAAKDFAISAAAGAFLGPFGFGLMAAGAILASASAINADYFGAAKLPPELATHRQLPSAFYRSIHGGTLVSLLSIGVLALAAVNFIRIEALSAATSGGFLLVFAVVNIAAMRLAAQTGASPVLCGLAALLCLAALGIMMAEFLSTPETVGAGLAVAAIVAVSLAIEALFRALEPNRETP